MTRQEAEAIEQDILIRRHIERYAIIRQFAYGRSVDCACGVGYGTHILAKNADVRKIYGIDSDPACIAHARKEFSGDKIEFIQGNIDAITIPDIDFMASLETIEHLPDPRCLNDFARRCNVQEILVSFPAKKTTHYNKYHYWDLTTQDVLEIFGSDFVLINSFSYTFDTQFVHLARLKRDCVPPRRFWASRR
ncbi:MAG: class I SAM-dependent methyltransferase [Acidobacteriota bacterium]|nr:class I SAM-dependent methyltransferase [Acidobacteriota bacterium]